MSDISKTISCNSLDRIHRPSTTLKDSLESRLKREGYVEGVVENKKTYYKLHKKVKNYWKTGYHFYLHILKYE